MRLLKNLLMLLRVSHWSKSAFVLLGVVYSGEFSYFTSAIFAAFSFCLMASTVYIYNDINDKELDKMHPHKCHRPLANGQVSVKAAFTLLYVLLFLGLFIAWLISSKLLTIVAIYLLINLAYNHGLKDVAFVDVICIASGFMLRVLAGTIGIGLAISWWLTLSATLVSLFIALCKRRCEKQLDLTMTTRTVLEKYSSKMLNYLISAVALFTLITYLFYAFYVRGSVYFLLTIPFAVIGLSRFAWLTTCNFDNDDPVVLFLSDYLSQFNLLCFSILTFIALYQ